MLKTHYALYQFLTRQVEELEAEIARRMQPYTDRVDALVTIPGVEKIAPWHLIPELGADMSVFPDADHCASWAGLSPGSCESAGKQVSSRTKKGNKYFAPDLDAIGLGRLTFQAGIPGCVLPSRQSQARWARAVIAVAHKILVFAYCIRSEDWTALSGLGDDYFDKLHPERTAKRLVHQLERLGLTASVTPSADRTPDYKRASGKSFLGTYPL